MFLLYAPSFDVPTMALVEDVEIAGRVVTKYHETWTSLGIDVSLF